MPSCRPSPDGLFAEDKNLEQAQKLLGHATRDMTEHYTKKRAGEKVRPVRRKL
jgi:integrase